jgi:hypothetical protein
MTNGVTTPSGRYPLITLTAAAAVAAIHHVYRLGPGVLIPAAIITALPYLLLRRYRSSGSGVALWSYAGLAALIFLWFGLVDGFLDHVMKALGFQHTTLLPGGDATVVHTVLSLWAPEAGNLFYEGTGILEFLLSTVAMYFCHRFLRQSRPGRTPRLVEGSDAAPAQRNP